MAKNQKKNEKRGPVKHKVLSDRGVHLEQRNIAATNSSILHGLPAIVGQDAEGKDIMVKIGQKCPKCNMRVRGFNHANGDHHRGTVPTCRK